MEKVSKIIKMEKARKIIKMEKASKIIRRLIGCIMASIIWYRFFLDWH
jgi:hypothetical protein